MRARVPGVRALLLCGALAAAGCGKKGPPLPPLGHHPLPVENLSARQVGPRIILTMPRPERRTDGTPIGPDAAIEIFMTAREPPPKRALDVEQEPALSWRIPPGGWGPYAQGKRLEVGLALDRIATGLDPRVGAADLSGRKLSFVVVVEEGRKRSDPSEIRTHAVCDPPRPPALAARNVEEGIQVTWEAGAAPGDIVIYRRGEEEPRPDTPVHSAPSSGPAEWLDSGALIGRRYTYVARSRGPAGARCESSDSAAVVMTRVDAFPPQAPQGLAAVAEAGSIRLFWRPNREPDLHGYRVYRADVAGGPFRLLTTEDLTTTSYTDRDVAAGVDYTYVVTARDGATPPNESPFSESATEKAEHAR